MRNKDTRLIWEAFGRGNAFRVDRGDLPPNPNDSEFANWITGKAMGFEDGGMDDQTRADFHSEIEEHIDDVDPVKVAEHLKWMSSFQQRDSYGIPNNEFVIDEIEKAIEWISQF